MNNSKDMQVLIIVIKDILNKIITEDRTDITYYLDYIILDIKERSSGFSKYLRKPRVINLYDIKISNGCV